MTEKKKVLCLLGICVLVAALLLVFGDREANNPFSIRRGEVEWIELKTYSHSHRQGKTQQQLTEKDIDNFVDYFNAADYDPTIMGEPCCDTYWLEVYLKDGTMIRVSEGSRGKMIVRPKGESAYYMCSRKLVGFVLDLVKGYDLVRD